MSKYLLNDDNITMYATDNIGFIYSTCLLRWVSLQEEWNLIVPIPKKRNNYITIRPFIYFPQLSKILEKNILTSY